MKTLNCSSRLSRSNFDKPAEYFRLKVGNILARSGKLTHEKFHWKNSYRQSSPVNTRKEVSTTVTNFIIRKSELFLLEVRKNSNFFFVTPKFPVKMLLCTSWLLFGHPCSKLFAQSWRRIEKIQEIQKRYFFPSKVLDYSKLAVPCQRGEIPLGKICSFEKMVLKSITLVRLPWNEFSKSFLFNFVTVYKERNLFAFENLKICRTVIFEKTRLCLPKKTSLT